MFLFIFEDGEMVVRSSVQKEELQYCDDGILEVIDISDNSQPKRYFSGGWATIENDD